MEQVSLFVNLHLPNAGETPSDKTAGSFDKDSHDRRVLDDAEMDWPNLGFGGARRVYRDVRVV
jgi:hypothetical protein